MVLSLQHAGDLAHSESADWPRDAADMHVALAGVWRKWEGSGKVEVKLVWNGRAVGKADEARDAESQLD